VEYHTGISFQKDSLLFLPERKLHLISAIPGLSSPGGLSSESVQLGFPCRIVVPALAAPMKLY